MKKAAFVMWTILLTIGVGSVALAQSDIRIKKKIKMEIPGMERLKDLPQTTQDNMKDALNRTATVYLKAGRMRTDMPYKAADTFGGLKTRTMTTILQCDKGLAISFNDQKKKYYVENSKSNGTGKKGGFVTFSMTVTDTGERLKLFGYDARHIKRKITITPGANACQKTSAQIEIDGWYADIPSFSCPIMPDMTEIQAEKGCFDEIVFEIKGETVTGVPVKEIKKVTIEGKTISIEEEVIELVRTTLDAALFEPPPDYKPADNKAEVAGNNDEGTTQTQNTSSTSAENQMTSTTIAPTLAPPTAGVSSNAPLPPKKEGTIRIGVAKPKIVTPESKKDPAAGTDIADAVTKALVESLKAEKVEAVELSTSTPEAEAKEKQCDYIFYASVTQKRGGGGMFGKMLAVGALGALGGMVPGVGGIIASTVAGQVMGQAMGKAAKAKDEFTFDYKVAGPDNAILAQAVTKAKAKEDGEDVLSPQIKQASSNVLGEIAKKK